MTAAAIILFTVAGVAAVIGFPLAVLDNPQRRRRASRRDA